MREHDKAIRENPLGAGCRDRRGNEYWIVRRRRFVRRSNFAPLFANLSSDLEDRVRFVSAALPSSFRRRAGPLCQTRSRPFLPRRKRQTAGLREFIRIRTGYPPNGASVAAISMQALQQ